VGAILLAKESLILSLVARGYVAIRLAVTLIFVHDWRVLLGLLLSGGILFATLRSRAAINWKTSRASMKGLGSLDLLVGVGGLGAAFAVAMWMKPYTDNIFSWKSSPDELASRKLTHHAPARDEDSLQRKPGKTNPRAVNFVAHIQSN